MTAPKFCPNCGHKLVQKSRQIVPIVLLSGSGHPETRGYDTYCGWCKWSGDILPDDEDGEEQP